MYPQRYAQVALLLYLLKSSVIGGFMLLINTHNLEPRAYFRGCTVFFSYAYVSKQDTYYQMRLAICI